MSYKAWSEENLCWDCGRKPSRKEYRRWLEGEVERLETIVAYTTEEFAEWQERRKTQFPNILSEKLLDGLRPINALRPFMKDTITVSLDTPNEDQT